MWTDHPAAAAPSRPTPFPFRAEAMPMEPATAADARLAAVVASALARRRGIPAGQVTAVVCHGWVTLAGEVEWLYQRAEAYDAVHALPGVVGCTNRISVSPRTCAR